MELGERGEVDQVLVKGTGGVCNVCVSNMCNSVWLCVCVRIRLGTKDLPALSEDILFPERLRI